MEEKDSKQQQVVELNVGGVLYATTLRTLTSDSDSLFIKLLNNSSEPLKDNSNKLFIDRDGILFRYILDYMRNKTLILPENFSERHRLKCEAEYYQLKGLLRLIDDQLNHVANNINLSNCSLSVNSSSSGVLRKKHSNGCILVGYRGTFANGREGLSDVKFRKISRILICGRVQLCREVFGDTLNESRDPDHGVSDRYTSRFFLKHTFLEQAFDTLAEAEFKLVCAAATGTNSLQTTDKDAYHKAAIDNEENRWLHYNEFVFVRD